MEAGKITRPLRAILGLPKQAEARDRDPQQGGAGYKRRGRGRPPSREELDRAREVLLQAEGIKKAALQVEIAERDGAVMLLVKDADGRVVRAIGGEDVFLILEAAHDEERGAVGRGCILDRRL